MSIRVKIGGWRCSWAAALTLAFLFAGGCSVDESSKSNSGVRSFAPLSPNGEVEVLRDGERVGLLPAEYIPLDYPDMPWRGDPGIGMSADGTIYIALYAKIFVSTDGGRTWEARRIDVGSLDPPTSERANYDSFVVLRDGTLLWAYHSSEHETDFVIRSKDGGKTWEPWSRIVDRAPFDDAGGNQNCMTELKDGTILWPMRLGPASSKIKERDAASGAWQGPPHWTTYVYRSTDGGRTWGEKSPLQE